MTAPRDGALGRDEILTRVIRRLTRPVLALLVLAAAGTTLSACASAQAGAAAFVGSDRITQNSVEDYIDQGVTPPATVNPRSITLQTLIVENLTDRALAVHGGAPDNGQLVALHDEVLSQVLQQQVSGAQADAAARQVYARAGLDDRFDALFLRTDEKQDLLAQRIHATTSSDLPAALSALHVPVKVNPRYGSWDASQLGIAMPTTPAFLTLPSSSAAAVPAGG